MLPTTKQHPSEIQTLGSETLGSSQIVSINEEIFMSDPEYTWFDIYNEPLITPIAKHNNKISDLEISLLENQPTNNEDRL